MQVDARITETGTKADFQIAIVTEADLTLFTKKREARPNSCRTKTGNKHKDEK